MFFGVFLGFWVFLGVFLVLLKVFWCFWVFSWLCSRFFGVFNGCFPGFA